ncbi:hypothetical protein F7P69_01390 [Cellulosimicrobium funkei]|nr:hypothetical protein [Cellulosimicrobium funkei]
MRRTSSDAMKDATTAETKAAELEAKATEAEAAAQRLDADSMAALVDNPGQAEGITSKISAQERLARAYRSKAAEHREKVQSFQREALELEAVDLHREADKLERDAEKQAEKIADALQKLEALDGGCKYEPAVSMRDRYTNAPVQWHAPKADQMRADAKTLRARAGHNRYFLEHRRLAAERYELNEMLTDTLSTLETMWLPEGTTSDLLAQIASGNVPAEPGA